MGVTELLSRLSDAFSYDPETGVVTRREARGNRSAGSAVGTRSSFGHLSVQMEGRTLQVHRVAWALHYGEWPAFDIDHANGIPHDNRITNLRLATASENLRNSRPYRKRSGLPRVVTRARGRRFVARITAQPGCCAQYLGTFDTALGASDAYRFAAQSQFGAFYRGEQ